MKRLTFAFDHLAILTEAGIIEMIQLDRANCFYHLLRLLTKPMRLNRFFLIHLLMFLGLFGVGCASQESTDIPEKLTVGMVSYGEEKISIDKFERFKEYLAAETQSMVEVEPTYNEVQAVEKIRQKRWDIVFSPPGLAALAIGKEGYIPIFSMQRISSDERALLVVREDSSVQTITDLANKTIALGKAGSAAGYYLPLYDMYGLTLAEVRFAPTPKIALQWLMERVVDAGALSEHDFEQYRHQFNSTRFRTLHTSRFIPAGVVLLGPGVDRNEQEQIEKAMREAPSDIAADAGYLPMATLPNYDQFIKLVEKVRPLEAQVRQKPAVLIYEASQEAANTEDQAGVLAPATP